MLRAASTAEDRPWGSSRLSPGVSSANGQPFSDESASPQTDSSVPQPLARINTRGAWERTTNAAAAAAPVSADVNQAYFWRPADDAQRYVRLNPDAPEFAPVWGPADQAAWEREQCNNYNMNEPRPRDDTEHGMILPREPSWSSGVMTSATLDSHAPRISQSMNTTYSMPLKTGQGDDASKPRLSRAISEGNLADKESMNQPAMCCASAGMSANRSQPFNESYGPSGRYATSYVTPNPSPNRPYGRQSVSSQSQVNVDGLVLRTKALLEHQMRTNLAFAEAVAAEYGRELSSRTEAQRRAFSAEQDRRLQLMDQAARRRVAEAEDSLRRQYEERFGAGLSLQGSGAANFVSEGHSVPPVVHKRLIELQREVAILQTELSVQHRANRNLRREAAEASHHRESAEGKANADADETRSRGSWSTRADSSSPFVPEMIDYGDLSNRSVEELCSIIARLSDDRSRVLKENAMLAARLEYTEAELKQPKPEDDSPDENARPRKSITWLEMLQTEVLLMEKNTKWTGQSGQDARSAVSAKVSHMLSELRKQAHRLERLLGDAPMRRMSVEQSRRGDNVWEQATRSSSRQIAALVSPTDMISMFDSFGQIRGDSRECGDVTPAIKTGGSSPTIGDQPYWPGVPFVPTATGSFMTNNEGYSQETMEQIWYSGLGVKGPDADGPEQTSEPSAEADTTATANRNSAGNEQATTSQSASQQ
ncbi:hypothetical protein HDU89_000265 [Geranomyces variabilis]|nr:hypothetical protein HDU89_000265 [Geranomyces variabilis]